MKGNCSNFSKEVQSPRFKAVLRVTSGRKKRTPDIKSFSHELNSKGVRPFPLWKPRTLGHMEVHAVFLSLFFFFILVLILISCRKKLLGDYSGDQDKVR